MFSEYASRFLAQSQSQLSIGRPDATSSPRNPSEHRSSSRTAGQRAPQRNAMTNPYQTSASQLARFPFGSRTFAAQPAPLFYSAADEFREEGDGEEYEREVADLHALQKSRRNFTGHLTESSDLDEPDSNHDRGNRRRRRDDNSPGFGRGIRSSWRGGRIGDRGRQKSSEVQEPRDRDKSAGESEESGPSSKGKANLVDVELESSRRDSGSVEELDKDEIDKELAQDDQPPAFQRFRRQPMAGKRDPLRAALPIPQETDEETLLENPAPNSPDRESVPELEDEIASERHDAFWTQLFLICKFAVFATFFLTLLQTSPPDKKRPLGDTIYSVLHSSFHLLGVYSLVAIIIGFLWLALLRSFVRPLVLLIVVTVPVVLFSFFLYPLISSYKGTWHGNSAQDRAMWWFSWVPAIFAGLWTYSIWQGRHSLTRAIDLLEFTGKVLTAMSPLVLVGLAALSTVVLYTWIWMLMFSRLFLEGHFSSSRSLFVIDSTAWWLGVAFVLEYLWTLGVVAGVQRATASAAVSQWYFHRNDLPKVSSRLVVQASLTHALTSMLGTIALSSFLTIAIRLPLLVLPRRLVGFFALCAYSLVPASIALLTNPLTLTYASIHSRPLAAAARGVSALTFISTNSPTTTLNPRFFSASHNPHATLLPYRLAKLLLHAIRFVMALALGLGGWVTTARALELSALPSDDGAVPIRRGSLYAYVVGLVAAAIGWSVLGAVEGVFGNALDAVVVCWGSEVGVHGAGEARYCREAGELLAEGAAGGYVGAGSRRGLERGRDPESRWL